MWRITLSALLLSLIADVAVAADAPPVPAATASSELTGPQLSPDPAMATRYHGAQPWQPVTSSRVLGIGEELRCSASCSFRLRDGSEVSLDAGTVVAFAPASHAALQPGGALQRCDVVEIRQGGLRLRMSASAARPLLVDSPAAPGRVAVVRGSAQLQAFSDRLVVQLPDAEAQRWYGQRWQPLAPGQGYVLRLGRPAEPRALFAAPRWQTSGEHHRPIALAIGKGKATVSSSWQPVAAATHYEVEVAADRRFSRVIARLRVPRERHHVALALGEGRYHARLTAVGADGERSMAAEPRALRVVRAVLPPGGYMPRPDTVVLPVGSGVRLAAASDVEAAVGWSGYRALPRELGAKGRGHELSLRLVGEPETATALTVRRRALAAKVELTPRLPLWPSDSIVATVHLLDPSGHTDLRRLRPKLEVRVGGVKVGARWQRKGSVLKATIAQRPIAGPALVEVFVRDGGGALLGWGFVEVIGPAPLARAR
jgi:hypothetical protein